MKGLDEVASVVRRVFRTQKQQYLGIDKEKFADWNAVFAKQLEGAVLDLYLGAARSAAAKKELAPEFRRLAKDRAKESAREINHTTGDWLQEGRDYKDVFGDDRVVTIATTEANHAIQAGRGIVAEDRGKSLRWKAGPKACDVCKKLNGKVRKPGKAFAVAKDGTAIFQPPYHPNCDCSLEIVGVMVFEQERPMVAAARRT